MRALVLAGHGSHISPNTAGIVWSYVDQLRQWGVADEITACFWKEQPSFNQVLDTLLCDEIVVVPLFTATGYFSQTVIPAEMQITGQVTRQSSKTIYYTATIGEHPSLAEIVEERVRCVLATKSITPHDTAVAVIGHGTPRSARSQNAAHQQAAILREKGLVAEVTSVYLDDEPDIPSIYDTTQSSNIIAVPFFLAPGSHVTQDVPHALGLNTGEHESTVRGRQVYYTAPVGTHETMCDLILDMARSTGLAFDIQPDQRDKWTGFPQYGSQIIAEKVNRSQMFTFGQLQLSSNEVRPVNTPGNARQIESPAELRKIVRENPFRPLPTSNDLPGGWYVPVTAPHVLPAIIETVYPGALADWAHQQHGSFRPETLHDFSRRQTGIFKHIHKIDPEILADKVSTICGQCVRQPTWYEPQHTPNNIPCKAPCNTLLSGVKEAI